ncbi:hypothetical protein [Methyloversatilis sp. XJ19-49]|uniref:hypothetical protein n=1 Tax=Methyloversatilis sp. XJ19-49 TaxID=2963429 RepID=UPI00211BB940|nr:hypothetical protein [Methyloversatilis sp. XJ19-49]MCQ9377758.1 hypothetical protein [Methyloversatilis sp. XJ19-49]
MSQLIEQARLKVGFKSNDALAEAILLHRPELALNIQRRSLGTRIGKLAKGEVDWWQRNLGYLDALTEVLNVDPSDIGIHEGNGGQLYSFAEFPELPPLDLRSEAPYELAFARIAIELKGLANSDHPRELDLKPWLLKDQMRDARKMPRGVSWLWVPTEVGAELLIKQLQATSAFKVLKVESLQDVKMDAQSAMPLVIVLSTQSDGEDLVLSESWPEITLLVICPFSMPNGFTSNHGTSPPDGEFSNSPPRTSNPPWFKKSFVWTLHDDWRKRLIVWVQQRLDTKKIDTLLAQAEVMTWLEVLDPEERLVRTPSDVLTVCRMFHSRSKKGRPDPAGRDVGRRLQSCFAPIDSRTSDTFNRLADAVWQHINHPWGDPMEWEKWRHLCSFEGSPALNMDAPNDPNAVKTVKSSKRPRQKIDAVSTLLDDLKRHGLLASVPRRASGDYALKPQLLADLRIRDLLAAEIQSANFQTWGRLSLDPDRQYLIDAALSAASMTDLLQTVRMLRSANPWEASAVGASESLFLELGNRRAEGHVLDADMHIVTEMVLNRYFESGNSGVELLLTRKAVSRVDHPDVLQTISACMGWSLTIKPKMYGKLNPAVLQLFPGWAGNSVSLPPMPDHAGARGFSEHSSSSRWRRFMTALYRVFIEIESWPAGSDEPRSNVLAPLLIAAGLSRGERISVELWAELALHQWAIDFVVEQLEKQRSDGLATVALRLILTAVYEGMPTGNFPSWSFFLFKSNLWRWAIKHSAPAQYIAQIDYAQISVLQAQPHIFPDSWRHALLEALPISERGDRDELILTAGTEARTLLLKRLGTPEGEPAAKRLWQLSEEDVLRILESGKLDVKSTFDLLWHSPYHMATPLARYVSELPAFDDKKLRRDWIIKRLSGNAMLSDQLLTLLH